MNATPSVSFSIGVIGNMDLAPAEIHRAKEHLRLLFRLFRSEPKSEKRDELLLQLNAMTSCQAISGARPDYDNSVVEAFRQWPNLHHLPITISTNIAPGADMLAVEVATEDEFASKQFFVKAILPYPSDIYVGQASTYNTKLKDGTPDPANVANQQKFHEVLKRLGDSTPQVVRKSGEESLNDDAFYSKCKAELDGNDSAPRHSRYYAAGEYLAVNCHLLIAIWDSDHDKDTENGTGALVFARRFGPRQNILPTTSSLGLPHGGPLVHIPVRRLKNDRKKDVPISSPFIRFLHPFAYTSGIKQGDTVGASQLVAISDTESQKSGFRVLRSVLENLVWFHQCSKPGFCEMVIELEKRLTPRTCETLKEVDSDSYESMAQLLETRKAATAAQSILEPVSRRALRRMFWMVSLAAILFHLFAEWHPQVPSNGSSVHGEAQMPADKSHGTHAAQSETHGSNSAHNEGIRPLIGVASAIAAFIGIWIYLNAKSSRRREHADDVRALAEGLRVQFYWNITGVGRSVPANYSLRQRSELDWIRSVIRGTSAPYDQWARWFDQLAHPVKIQMLEACLKGWIIDQERYFRDGSDKKHQELHFWHRTGVLLAWSGVFVAILLVVLNCFGTRLRFLQEHAWFFASVIPVFAMIVYGISCVIRAFRATSLSAHSHSLNPFKGFVWSRIFTVQSAILRYEDEHTDGPSKWLSLRNFFVGLPSIVLLAYSGIVFTALLASIPLPVPDAFTLSSVLAGAFLLAGGLLIAWGEKQQLSETGYQFNTMATLFRSSRIQFEKYLADLKILDTDNPEQISKAQALVDQLQEFIYELGREALDENAEWLILHRARPLEPVMAG